MLDEMQEEEEEEKCRLRKKRRTYDKTKFSKLGRSMSEPMSLGMSRLQLEDIQNHEKHDIATAIYI